MIQKSSSKAWEGHAKALGFSAAIAPGYQGSADIKLSAVPSLTNQTGYSFSPWDTVILQFNEKFGIGTFLQYVILLVIGLKILSLKQNNEENDSFSPTEIFFQRISHTHKKSSLHDDYG